MPLARFKALVVDAVDPERMGRFWAPALGLPESEKGWSWLEEVPGMPFECLVFTPVPEPKTVKNRIHWDVTVPGEAGVEAVVAHGATVLRRPDDEISWTVLADPEGNEFCAFV